MKPSSQPEISKNAKEKEQEEDEQQEEDEEDLDENHDLISRRGFVSSEERNNNRIRQQQQQQQEEEESDLASVEGKEEEHSTRKEQGEREEEEEDFSHLYTFSSFFSFPLVPQNEQEEERENDEETTITPTPTFSSITVALLPQFLNCSGNLLANFIGQTYLVSVIGRHFDATSLGALGSGLSLANLLGIALGVGFAGAVDSLGSIAFGRGDMKEVARVCQVGLVLLFLLNIPFACMFFFSRPIISFVFGEIYADKTCEFLRWSIPYLFLNSTAFVLQKTLQSQHRSDISFKARLVSCCVMLVSVFFLVNEDLQLRGAALSLNLQVIAQILAIIGLVLFSKGVVDQEEKKNQQEEKKEGEQDIENNKNEQQQQQQHNNNNNNDNTENEQDIPIALKSISWFSLQEWKTSLEMHRVKDFLRVGTPVALSTFAEWSGFEACSVIASLSGTENFGAFQIYLSISVLLCAPAFALATCACSWVGRLLGEAKGLLAFYYGRTCALHAALLGLFSSLLLVAFHSLVFSLYTRDERIQSTLFSLLPIYIVLRTVDNVQLVLQCIFRGAKRPDLTLVPVTLCLIFVGLPCAFTFSKIVGWHLPGQLLGFSFGLILTVPFLLYRLGNREIFDWIKLGKELSDKEKNNNNKKKENEKKDAVVEVVVVGDEEMKEKKRVVVGRARSELVAEDEEESEEVMNGEVGGEKS